MFIFIAQDKQSSGSSMGGYGVCMDIERESNDSSLNDRCCWWHTHTNCNCIHSTPRHINQNGFCQCPMFWCRESQSGVIFKRTWPCCNVTALVTIYFFFLLYVILANKVENWRKFHHTPRTVRCQQWPIGKCISGAKWMFPLEAEKCFDFVRVRAKKALLRIVMASRDICGHTSHLLMVFTQRPKLIIIRPMARYHSIEHTSDKAIAKVKQSENDESHCNCVG